MKREFIVFLLVLVFAFVGVFGPVWYHLSQTPAGTIFPYADGWLLDYYQYLSWIRDGMDGNIFVNTSYTEKIFPKLPIQVYFPMIGFLGRLLGIKEAFQIHLLGRIFSLSLLLGVYWWAARKLYTATGDRVLALMALLATSGFWWLKQSGGGWELREAITWSGNFNVIGKFGMPPHHALAIALLLVSGYLIIGQKAGFSASRRTGLAKLILIPIAIGLLNPSILIFGILIWGGCFLITGYLKHINSGNHQDSRNLFLLRAYLNTSILRMQGISRYARNDSIEMTSSLSIPEIIALIFISLPILLYHFWVFQNIEPWSVMYAKMKAFNPPTTFWQYLLALGPVGWMGVVGVVSSVKYQVSRIISVNSEPTNQLTTFLSLWSIIPLVLFPFAGNLLPMNTSRMFQSYQFIPLALLAPLGIRIIARKLTVTKTIMMIIFVIYASVPYLLTLKTNLFSFSTSWYNMYLPNDFVKALDFLKNNTDPESVVVSGEYASLMIPAFTHNRTLIARDDIRPDYYQVRDQVFALVDGQMSESDAREFMKERNVKYLLLGLDTRSLFSLPQLQKILTPVFNTGTITIVRPTN